MPVDHPRGSYPAFWEIGFSANGGGSPDCGETWWSARPVTVVSFPSVSPATVVTADPWMPLPSVKSMEPCGLM
jgi:hypothetical protein